MNKRFSAVSPYVPGIILISFGLLVAAVPELLVAIISAALIVAGIAALVVADHGREGRRVEEWRILWPAPTGDRRDFFGRIWIRRHW